MGMVIMDIEGLVEATTSEVEEATIKRGFSTEVIIGEATLVVITEQAGLTVSVGESGMVITTRSAVERDKGGHRTQTNSILGSGLDALCYGTGMLEGTDSIDNGKSAADEV